VQPDPGLQRQRQGLVLGLGQEGLSRLARARRAGPGRVLAA
jgi:hypothetical protein